MVRWNTAVFAVCVIYADLYLGQAENKLEKVETTFQFKGHRYVLVTLKKRWYEAEEYCKKAFNMNLVIIESKEENDRVKEKLQRVSSESEWWIGFNDVRREGTFVDVCNNKIKYTNWWKYQPNNLRKDNRWGEDCVEMSVWSESRGQWNDDSCNDYNFFLCETDAACGSTKITTTRPTVTTTTAKHTTPASSKLTATANTAKCADKHHYCPRLRNYPSGCSGQWISDLCPKTCFACGAAHTTKPNISFTIATNTSPKPTTSSPKPTTTNPKPNSTTPRPTTTTPKPTTTTPKPTTTSRKPTTTSPKPTTTTPKPITTSPKPTTTSPKPTTTTPKATTTSLKPTTTTPKPTTTTPKPTTTTSKPTTTTPKRTTTSPKPTTTTPKPTTTSPKPTTTTPKRTTTTPKPTTSTSKPTTTTPKPTTTTPKPTTTTSKLTTTTPKPTTTTPKPTTTATRNTSTTLLPSTTEAECRDALPGCEELRRRHQCSLMIRLVCSRTCNHCSLREKAETIRTSQKLFKLLKKQ